MRLEWSRFALADRDEIFDHIEADNPRAAAMVDERIGAQAALLTQFPQGGRPGRVEGARELIVRRTPYIAAYRIAGDIVRILRILHGSRQWPDDMPD
ncbi:MAG: type II toxin-antitoxin system RelE/ParE family toxin [Roseiarcus sp.]